MLLSEFNKLPISEKAFISFAPNVRTSSFDHGILEYHSFDPWKSNFLEDQYESEKLIMLNRGDVLNETILYHGCPIKSSIENIANKGFDISYVGTNTGNQGLYGKGIYFSKHPNGSIGYSTHIHQWDALEFYNIIVSKVLVGKSLEIKNGSIGKDCIQYPYVGINLIQDYNSHSHGDEVVIFNTKQILPLGLLHCSVVPTIEDLYI